LSAAAALAFSAGALGLLALAEAAGAAAARLPGLAAAAASLGQVVARVGSEGRDPVRGERRRLLLLGAVLAFVAGWLLAGVAVGVALAFGGPWLVGRMLHARRERYRRAVDSGAAGLALAMADALGGGHSLRGALHEAARGVPGAAGRELRRVSAELALGARTEDALEAMRKRVRSHRMDTIVAACLLQRRAGGDLARLLRESAHAFEDQARLEDEVRAATAQARFTGLLVVLLPLGGALLAELASPGYLRGLAGSFLTLWLGGLALMLQAVAAVLIRRLARVKG
jgi:tight adherence protein B